MKKTISRGFTLIELMVTLTLVVILAVIAVPNFRDFGRNGALTSAANNLLHSLQIARAEASKRQINVVMCASSNPTATTPTCDKTGIKGWIVFLDVDGNWDYSSSETLIETQTFDSGITLLADQDAVMSYASSGFANPAGAKTPSTLIVLCDARGNQTVAGQSTARGINISRVGRGNVTRTTSDIATMLDASHLNSNCPP